MISSPRMPKLMCPLDMKQRPPNIFRSNIMGSARTRSRTLSARPSSKGMVREFMAQQRPWYKCRSVAVRGARARIKPRRSGSEVRQGHPWQERLTAQHDEGLLDPGVAGHSQANPESDRISEGYAHTARLR